MPTVRQQEKPLAVVSLDVRSGIWIEDVLVPCYLNHSIKSMSFGTWHNSDSIPDHETSRTTFLNHSEITAF